MAGRGLGRPYVELLAERGARVVVSDLGTDVSGCGKDSAIAEQVADLIRSRGGEAIANDSDVSAPEGGSGPIATTIERFGRIDLLVNNAGICGSQPIEDASLDDFDHYWRVRLGGPVNTVKAAWPHMVAQRCGKIILTTSVSGLFGLRGQATQDPGCPKQMEEPPCRLRLLRQRSSGWQATGVRSRTTSTTVESEQSNVSPSLWDLASTIHI